VGVTTGRAPRTPAGEGRGGGRLAATLLACLLLVPAPVVAAPEPAQRSPAEVAAEVDALLPRTPRAAPPCDDAAFVRRLTLDLHGTLPAPAAAKAFVAEREQGERGSSVRPPGKRARLAEALARDPAFARRFAELLGRGWLEGALPDDDGGRFLRAELTGWLERSLQEDTGLDRVVAELIAAEGTTDERPATIYAFAHGRDDLADLAGAAARDFLGSELRCARCHDHPFEATKQTDFHALAAYFVRARIRPEPGRQGVYRVSEAPLGEHRWSPGAGEARVESAPAPPGPAQLAPGVTPAGSLKTSRRAELARWVTSPANPRFAPALADRLWTLLLGRPAPAPVAAALGRELVASGHSLRRLVLVITATAAYGRASSIPGVEDLEPARAAFAAARVRPLDAPTLARVLLAAAGRDRPGPGESEPLHRALVRQVEAELAGALPGPGEAARDDPEQASAALGLALVAGRAVPGLARGPLLTRLLEQPPAERQGALWWATVGRDPRPDERRLVTELLASTQDPRRAWEELAWALLASSELATNH
jgi:hypothetical protein